MSKSFFLGASHAAIYAKYRPQPPQQLTDRILQYLQEKMPSPLKCAVDVGCGSGQSTLILAPFFQHVLGTDVSQNQLSQARKSAEGISNVAFSVARAEELPVENGTVHLITAAQCFHWFDAEKFYLEAKRILVPNGVLAIYTYLLPLIKTADSEQTKRLYDHLMKLYSVKLQGYWDPARFMVDRRYDTIRLPFRDPVRIDGIWSSKMCTVADYHGYVSTWSAYQNYSKDKGKVAGEELLSKFINGVLEILHSTKSMEETPIQVDIEYFMLLGRNLAPILEPML